MTSQCHKANSLSSVFSLPHLSLACDDPISSSLGSSPNSHVATSQSSLPAPKPLVIILPQLRPSALFSPKSTLSSHVIISSCTTSNTFYLMKTLEILPPAQTFPLESARIAHPATNLPSPLGCLCGNLNKNRTVNSLFPLQTCPPRRLPHL